MIKGKGLFCPAEWEEGGSYSLQLKGRLAIDRRLGRLNGPCAGGEGERKRGG